MKSIAKKLPYGDALGEFHDGVLDLYNSLTANNKFFQNKIVYEFVNLSTIIPAYGLTVTAAMQPHINTLIMANNLYEKEY